MSEFTFRCDKCPRTFKLEEFYEKHKKVHDLKKQHKCGICGFVYGAAKGLEGHLKSHTEAEIAASEVLARGLALNVAAASAAAAAAAVAAAPPPSSSKPAEPPINTNFLSLNPRGVLAQAPIPQLPKPIERPSNPNGGTGNYEVYDHIPPEAEKGIQNNNGYFICKICNREFSGLNSLKKHIPIHTRKVQHKCDACGHVFGKKEYLLDHMRRHTGEVSPLCEVCGRTFSKTLKLKDHFKVHRNLEDSGKSNSTHPFKCHICLSVFEFTSALGKHLITSHPENFIKCDMCNATFGDVRGKNHHMLSEHQSDQFSQKKVWCPVCNQGFTRAYNLKVHMYKNHGKEVAENNFSKKELAETKSVGGNKSEGSKFNHYFDAKQGTQMLQCQMCDGKFVRKNDLYIHLDADHGVILVGCTSCEEKFLDVLALQEHISAVHGSPKAVVVAKKRRPGPASKTNAPAEQRVAGHKCEICHRGMDSRAALTEHVLTTHVKGFKFPCELCGCAFQTPAELSGHQKVKHPNLSKRAAQMRSALGLEDATAGGPAAKRPCLDNPDKHVTETDAMRPSLVAAKEEAARAVREANEAKKAEEDQEDAQPAPEKVIPKLELSEPLAVVAIPMEQDVPPQVPQSEEEEVTYEPITEPFMFEDKIIHPCYVVLPYVTDLEVEAVCNPRRFTAEDYAMVEGMDDDEDRGLTIDESVGMDEDIEDHNENQVNIADLEIPEKQRQAFSSPPISFAGLEPLPPQSGLLQHSFAALFRNFNSYNAEDLNVPTNAGTGFYPKISDYSLPFSLGDLWKKKAEHLGSKANSELELLDKIEQMRKYNGTLVGGPDAIDRLNLQARSPPSGGSSGKTNKKKPTSSTASPPDVDNSKASAAAAAAKKEAPVDASIIQGYENSIQNDVWPMQCIKCVLMLDTLEAFNLHMNDHWSEDKCCPVCGLLINSKRFNFKQHLKIHTGEKPFVCKICSRAFRQKAHMVKHISIHRTLGEDMKQELVREGLLKNGSLSPESDSKMNLSEEGFLLKEQRSKFSNLPDNLLQAPLYNC